MPMEGGRLGKYEIRGTLGRGAMGVVYDGYDPAIDRRVAIKTLPLPDPSDTEATAELARFRREAQAAGRLTHPNIVGVFDYRETDRLAYIVMEFVDGTTLKQVLERQDRLPPAEAVRVMTGVLAGLRYSHERGVVHRDIKPGNIMLTRDGQAKIADFGIARIDSSSMTQLGTLIGTPAYMSPEQFMGQTVDARTDIYSAGVVLFQLLTGERPFEGSMTAIMHRALNTDAPRPSELSVTAPPALDAVVARAMARRPDARFPSAEAFAAALAAASAALDTAGTIPDADSTIVRAPPAPPASVPRTTPSDPPGSVIAKRTRLPLVAGAAVVALAAAAAGGYFAGMFTAPPPPLRPETKTVAAAPEKTAIENAVPEKPANTAPQKTVAAEPPASTAAASDTRLTPAALRSAIADGIAPVACQLAGGDVDERGGVTLTGAVGQESEARLRAAVSAAARGAPTDWRAASIPGPYCPVLDALRPASPAFGAGGSVPDLALRDGERPLTIDKDYIVLRVTTPDFPSYLTLDYFSGDGKLFHLAYQTRPGLLPIPPRHTVTVGDPKVPLSAANFPADVPQGNDGWQAGEPPGADLIVAIFSEKPLFKQPGSANEAPAVYLRDLTAALDAATREGRRPAVRVLPVSVVGR